MVSACFYRLSVWLAVPAGVLAIAVDYHFLKRRGDGGENLLKSIMVTLLIIGFAVSACAIAAYVETRW